MSIPRLTKILKEKHPDLNKSQLESKIFLKISEKISNEVIKNLNKDVKIEVSD